MDIKDEHLDLVSTILKNIIPHRQVLAFGSRVTKTATPTSDLDLCVMGEDKLSFEELSALRHAFSHSNLPYKVDIVDWASLDKDFQQIIQSCHEVLASGH